MAKNADFQNSLVSHILDYVRTSDTNTSNTNAHQSITTKSAGSYILSEFEEEEELNSTDSTISPNNIVNLYSSEDHVFTDSRPSTIDDTFLCQTNLCECKVKYERNKNLRSFFSVSGYSVDSSVLSSLSGTLMTVNDPENIINLCELGDTYSSFHKNTEKKFIYQDCKCVEKKENKKNKMKNADYIRPNVPISAGNSGLLNVTYTVSDDLGSIPDLSLAGDLIPEQTDTEHSIPFHSISNLSINDIENSDSNQLVYFTPDEVVIHNQADDLWVSYLGNVYNLTPLIEKHKGTREIKPLLAFAGKDISDWFDESGDLRHHIHPMTGVRVPYLPHGPIPDIRPHVPTTKWQPVCACVMNANDKKESFRPWWRCKRYFIGKLTKCARPIRIVNMLTLDECTLNVCCEDKLSRILERLSMFNSHGKCYTFKYDSRVLDMNKTLDENHVFDERETYLMNYLPEDTYIPALHLYFNDDLEWDLDTSDECDDD